ncbi:O-antigen ligase family protein [Candidatus Dojkabacteria bacterium]|uniref:O-antigen ligase family protein n=1 Tax=Candidatus Dojkabacteria bacterium TaxID=2099670 RepID=A0A955L7I9_9BACT|nr:O-antigen ligase family protein [Candidatus Dojkabacteria bacterium]
MKKFNIDITRFQTGILVGLLSVTPLLFSSSYDLIYELPKITFVKVLISLLIILELVRTIQSFLSTSTITVPMPQNKSMRILISCSVISLFWLSITTIFSSNTITSIWGNYDKRFGLVMILYLVSLAVLSAKIIRADASAFFKLLSYTLPITITINFVFSYGQLFRGFLDLNLTEGRAVGTFGQSNFLAGYMLMCIPLLLFFSFSSKRLALRLYYGLLALFGGICVVWAGSRLGYIFLILEVAATCLYGIFRLKKGVLRIILISFISILAVVSSVGFIIYNSRFSEFGIIDQTRKEIWHASIDAIIDNPIFGYGLDTQGYSIPTYMYKNGISTPVAVDRAHNEYLDSALVTGIVGAGLVFFCMIVMVYMFWGHKRTTLPGYKHAVILPIVSILVLFLLRSLVHLNGIVHYTLFSIMIGAGLAHVDPRIKRTRLISLKSKILVMIMFIGVLGFTLWGGQYAFSELKANSYYREYSATQDADFLRLAIEHDPWQVRYRIEFLGVQLGRKIKPDFETVLPELFQNQSRSYSQQYYYSGLYYEFTGNEKAASEYYKKAYEIEPVRDLYRFENE